MQTAELQALLDQIPDTYELVLHTPAYDRIGPGTPQFAVWRAARADAHCAYQYWCTEPSRGNYLVYRAAEDRADSAADSLARYVLNQ